MHTQADIYVVRDDGSRNRKKKKSRRTAEESRTNIHVTNYCILKSYTKHIKNM